MSNNKDATAKLSAMETKLHKFMEENASNEDDAMYAASVLMKCSMILYTQLLGVEDTKELLSTVRESVDEFADALDEVFDDEDDPFAGIDTTLPH